MANRNLNARQQQKHDTSSNFNSKNATYLEGEILIESDTGRVKIADGDTDYKTLPYTIGTRVPTEAKFTDTTYNKATDSSLGLVQVGYSTSGKNYAVTLDDSGNAYVNVPWTDSVANNPAITITQNGTSKGSFTLNQTSAETIDLTDTTYSNYVGATTSASGTAGLVPSAAAGAATRYLRSDGTWQVPPDTNTTYANFVGASSGTAGSAGLVPAPSASADTRFLGSTGMWTFPPSATTVKPGYMSAADKTKLDGIAANANNYYLPLAASSVRGGVRIGYATSGKNYAVQLSNEQMYVNVPWTDTTYTNFVKSGTGAKAGLVPAPSTTAGTTKFLREDATWVVPTDTKPVAGAGITVSGATVGLANSGVSTGTYGPTQNSSVDVIESFSTISVPSFTVDQFGRLTMATSRVITITASNFVGATTSTAGEKGLVPKPTAGSGDRYLRSDGTWAEPPTVNTQRKGYAPKAPGNDRQFLNGGGIWSTPQVADTGYAGYLPKLSGIDYQFLDGTGSWSTPPTFKGYTTGVAGKVGYVPAPMAANKFLKSDGTWADAVYGIKGNAETTYRVGQVNLTAANIGALSLSSGGTVSGLTTFESRVTITQAGFLTYDDGFY